MDGLTQFPAMVVKSEELQYHRRATMSERTAKFINYRASRVELCPLEDL